MKSFISRNSNLKCLSIVNKYKNLTMNIPLLSFKYSDIRLSSMMIPPTHRVPPHMDFLKNSTILLDTIDGTIDTARKLLNMLHVAETPKEKHDILDSCSNVLCLFLDPCEFVRQIHPDPGYRKAAAEAFGHVHEFMCEVNSRRELYDVILDLDHPTSRSQLSEEENKNITQLKRDMEANGIHLPDHERIKITESNIEKEDLTMRFIAERDERDPFGNLRNLLLVRYDQAQMLGWESCGHQVLQNTMMRSPENVWHFLCSVAHKYRPHAERELLELERHQGKVKLRDKMTDTNRAVITNNVRQSLIPDGIYEYFTVANCVRGIQCLCSEVFGLKVEEAPFGPDEKFDVDAIKFNIWDESNDFVGVVVLDMFSRESKHCQAGHLTIQLGCRPHVNVMNKLGISMPSRQYPIVVLTCSAGSLIASGDRRDKKDAENILMLPHEVQTCFHEFGHALHTLFGQTTVQNLAGTRSSVDYVELFSQFMEQFLTSHEFLKQWAHRRTDRLPISLDLVDRMNSANNAFIHLDTLDQVTLAAVDQMLHGPQPFTVYFPHGSEGKVGKRTLGHMKDIGRGTFNFAKLVIGAVEPFALVEPTESGVLRSLSFEHLATYPANYYGYLYSSAFAKRIWKKYFEHDPLNKVEGKRFANELMALGAAADPRVALANYLKEDINDFERWI